MIRAVFFDLWDTLITIPHFKEKSKKLYSFGKLSDTKYIYTQEITLWNKKAWTPEQFFMYCARKRGLLLSKLELMELTKKWYMLYATSRVYPDVHPVLAHLQERKLKLTIISNSTPLTEFVLKRTKLSKNFDHILLSYKEGIMKPDPRIYQKALQLSKVSNHEVLFVGDDINKDGKVPKSLGMQTLIIKRKHTTGLQQQKKYDITRLTSIYSYL